MAVANAKPDGVARIRIAKSSSAKTTVASEVFATLRRRSVTAMMVSWAMTAQRNHAPIAAKEQVSVTTTPASANVMLESLVLIALSENVLQGARSHMGNAMI